MLSRGANFCFLIGKRKTKKKKKERIRLSFQLFIFTEAGWQYINFCILIFSK